MWPWNGVNEILTKLIRLEDKVVQGFSCIGNELLSLKIKLDSIEAAVRVVIFRLLEPEEFDVTLLSQKEEIIMGQKKQVFTYQVAINAPKKSDVANQQFVARGVFESVEKPVTELVWNLDPVAQVLQVKAILDESVTLELSYTDAAGNPTTPRSTTFKVEDKVSPEAPDVDSFNITQLPIQEEVELPDPTPEPEPEPEEESDDSY